MEGVLNAVAVGVRRRICWAYVALIAVASMVPAWLFPASVAGLFGADLAAHAAMYGGLGALLRWTYRGGWRLPLAGAGYGLLMECCQLWLSGGARSFEWSDAAANLAGVVAGWGASGRIGVANADGG